MENGFQVKWLRETKKIVLILGITFMIAMAFQYFELPYGSVLSSLLPANKVSFPGKTDSSTGDLPTHSEKTDDGFSGFTNGTSFKSSLEESKNNSSKEVKTLASSSQPEKPSTFTLSPTMLHCKALPSSNSNSNSNSSSIFKVNELLRHSLSSPHTVACPTQFSSKVDQELLYAKLKIENPPIIENDSELYAPIYRNVSMFKRSYELMEQTLKVYIYAEGERPIFHQPVLTGIYASEGWFMKLLEKNKQFVTKTPKQAHLFYFPFSPLMLEKTLYVPSSHSFDVLIQYLKDYLDIIVARYPFWNRTCGADHFLVGCHDWAPTETQQHMSNCIRAICNANIKENFKFVTDVSLPTTLVSTAKNPIKALGGEPSSNRTILAFFAGKMHGYLRPFLLCHWENKDPNMKIFGKLPKLNHNEKYIHFMKNSKYCLCPKGYGVNSPRVVEAIFYECVPVIISDNFVPPFFEVLDWEAFAVFVREKDIPNLKNILLSISDEKYVVMQQRVKQVQQHFLWHDEPVKYDLFHMILHSIWYKRVFQVRPM